MLSPWTVRLSAALISLVIPSVAVARTCADLQSENQEINAQASQLASNNPGYALAFGSCGLTGIQKLKETNDATAALATGATCSATLCIPADSWRDCMKVNATLLGWAITSYGLYKSAKDIDCQL